MTEAEAEAAGRLLSAPPEPGTVHIVVPAGIDDPAEPSGGNTYDRRICGGLAANGWSVCEHPVIGSWPVPDALGRGALGQVLACIPDGAVVLIDGLIASAMPELMVPAADRLRLVVLMHMPLGTQPAAVIAGGSPPADPAAATKECQVLSAVRAVITTSEFTRRALVNRYALPATKVHVARPGVEVADPALGSPGGGELLCVAAVTPVKGHDILLGALTMVSDLDWRCRCLGGLGRDPDFVGRLRRLAGDTGIDARLSFTGPRTGADLDAAYAAADVLLLASRSETYAMVVTEALARGIPVIATDVGGVAEAVGRAPDGNRPGLLVAPEDPGALALGVRRWLTESGLRARLQRAARGRRLTLDDWSSTSMLISAVLSQASR